MTMKFPLSKSLLLGVVTVVGLTFAVGNAEAFLITFPTTDCDPDEITGDATCVLTGTDTSQSDIDDAIDAEFPGTTATEVYKVEVDGGNEFGSLAGSYTTTFFNEPDDPEDALIEWDGPGTLTNPTFALAKDGSTTPAWVLFDISDWNGTDDLIFEEFWPNSGAISHITLYGTTNGGGLIPVSEPATLGLFGLGLIGLGVAVRRRRS